MMYWLGIETSTRNCSVTVFEGESCLALVEASDTEKYIHAEKIHAFVAQALSEANISFADLKAVMLGGGPGSYTGLRIGASAAKGYCFSLNIPMMSTSSLDVLYEAWKEISGVEAYCVSAIDARRMEAFVRVYSKDALPGEIHPEIFTEESFVNLHGSIALVGDAADKAQDIFAHRDIHFYQLYPSARYMGKIGFAKFQSGDFEDLAYYAPSYGKEFIAGKPKK